MANDPAIPRDRIIYLVVEPSAAGKTALRFSLQPPSIGQAQAAFRLRGKIMDGSLLDVDLISNIDAMDLPAGPAGKDGTDGKDGVASTVAGPAGKDSTVAGPRGVAGATLFGTFTLTDKATIALSAGVRNVAVPVPGLAVGDAIILTPEALPPAGYAITAAVVTAPNTMAVTMVAPLLAAGAATSIAVRVYKINA